MRSSGRWLALPLLLVGYGAVYASLLETHGMLTWDEAEYASLGRSLLHRRGFEIGGLENTQRPPLVPAALTVGFALVGESDWAARWVVLVLSLLSLAIVGRASAEEAGHPTGLTAAALLGAMPAFVLHVPRALTENPMLGPFTLAVLCFHRGLHHDARAFQWSGLFAGLAVLTRYNAALFLPVAGVLALVGLATGGAEVRTRLFSGKLVMGAVAGLAVVAPWLMGLWARTGNPLAGFGQTAAGFVAFEPGRVLPWHFYASQLPAFVSWPVVFLALLGLVRSLRERDRLGLSMALVAFVVLGVLSGFRFKEMRQASAALPFLAVLAARGFTWPFCGPGLPRRTAIAIVGALAVAVGANLAEARQRLMVTLTLGYPSFVDAMRTLRREASPEAVVAGAPYPQLHWYSGRDVVPLPSSLEALPAVLATTEWCVIVNFERGQPAYANGLLSGSTRAAEDAGNLLLFRDSRYVTALVRSSWLARRLREGM